MTGTASSCSVPTEGPVFACNFYNYGFCVVAARCPLCRLWPTYSCITTVDHCGSDLFNCNQIYDISGIQETIYLVQNTLLSSILLLALIVKKTLTLIFFVQIMGFHDKMRQETVPVVLL